MLNIFLLFLSRNFVFADSNNIYTPGMFNVNTPGVVPSSQMKYGNYTTDGSALDPNTGKPTSLNNQAVGILNSLNQRNCTSGPQNLNALWNTLSGSATAGLGTLVAGMFGGSAGSMMKDLIVTTPVCSAASMGLTQADENSSCGSTGSMDTMSTLLQASQALNMSSIAQLDSRYALAVSPLCSKNFQSMADVLNKVGFCSNICKLYKISLANQQLQCLKANLLDQKSLMEVFQSEIRININAAKVRDNQFKANIQNLQQKLNYIGDVLNGDGKTKPAGLNLLATQMTQAQTSFALLKDKVKDSNRLIKLAAQNYQAEKNAQLVLAYQNCFLGTGTFECQEYNQKSVNFLEFIKCKAAFYAQGGRGQVMTGLDDSALKIYELPAQKFENSVKGLLSAGTMNVDASKASGGESSTVSLQFQDVVSRVNQLKDQLFSNLAPDVRAAIQKDVNNGMQYCQVMSQKIVTSQEQKTDGALGTKKKAYQDLIYDDSDSNNPKGIKPYFDKFYSDNVNTLNNFRQGYLGQADASQYLKSTQSCLNIGSDETTAINAVNYANNQRLNCVSSLQTQLETLMYRTPVTLTLPGDPSVDKGPAGRRLFLSCNGVLNCKNTVLKAQVDMNTALAQSQTSQNLLKENMTTQVGNRLNQLTQSGGITIGNQNFDLRQQIAQNQILYNKIQKTLASAGGTVPTTTTLDPLQFGQQNSKFSLDIFNLGADQILNQYFNPPLQNFFGQNFTALDNMVAQTRSQLEGKMSDAASNQMILAAQVKACTEAQKDPTLNQNFGAAYRCKGLQMCNGSEFDIIAKRANQIQAFIHQQGHHSYQNVGDQALIQKLPSIANMCVYSPETKADYDACDQLKSSLFSFPVSSSNTILGGGSGAVNPLGTTQ